MDFLVATIVSISINFMNVKQFKVYKANLLVNVEFGVPLAQVLPLIKLINLYQIITK